jgi:Bacterial surface proteins containing Ig-like domains
MKNTSLFRRILSVVLALAMIGSFLVPVASAEPDKAAGKTVEELTLTPIDPGELESQKLGKTDEETSIAQEDHALTDVVRVSIALDKASTLEAGFSAEGIANNAEAKAYRENLRADQAAVTAKIENAIGGKLDVQWNLTLAANFISANVLYGQIETIKGVEGVKDVFLENRYEPQVAEQGDEPNNGAASYMIGSNIVWAAGYTGAGSKVAVIDTGIDSEHQSFSGEGLEYALALNAEEKGMSYEDYIASLNLLTPESIDAVKDQLNANIGSGAAAYRSTKIGYGYNYVDKDVSYIEHIDDSQGEHGSHVEGISAANRFIKVDGEFKPALEAVGTQGVAPDAQIVTMKVFGKGGGAYDSDYMVAIEDAIILGCDSANLSLGSGAAGFGFSSGYEDVMNELVENGMVCSISAGNSGMWYDTPKNSSMYSYLYMDDNNYATGGSPGSFTNAFTVASVDNSGQTGMPLLFGDKHVFYNETSGYGNDPISTLAGKEYGYVYFDNYGADGDGNSQLAPYADVIEGKVVLCSRGTSSFYQKVNAAAEAGAVACIIYNNTTGAINMNLTGVTTNIPAVSILQADSLAIKAMSEPVTAEDGTTYYVGTMSIAEELEVYTPGPSDDVTVSSFSSYGVPGTLVLKPEILAPGGSIYSVNGLNNGGGGHDQYEVMSGTSMAAPQVNGMAGVLAQYIRENDLCEKTGLSQRQLINSLLMSTAHPVFDQYGEYYSVIRVGAGLAHVDDAVSAKSFILMGEDSTLFPDTAKDGKVKAELGDDPDRTGEYSFKFTVNPIEGAKEFTLRTDLFLQDYAGNGGYGMLQYTGTTSISNVIGYFGMSDPGYEVTYEVNGETYENTYMLEADVNMDGVTNAADAQAILNYLTDKLPEDADFDEAAADVDGDGKITTYDAHLILEAAATPTITAEEPTEVIVNIKLTDTAKEVLDYLYNSTYIQGYTFVDPVATREGEMDVVHSIPILAYYGSWTDAAMLDRTSAIDEAYGTGKLPYIGVTNINYLTMKTPNGESVVYMGNPYMVEDKFPAEKLAMNSEATITSYTYLNIRNLTNLGFAVQDEEGKVLFSQVTPTSKYGAYYYVNGGSWQNTSPATYNVGKKLSAAGVAEGDVVTVSFYALPEYYAMVAANMKGEVATSGSLTNEDFAAVVESGVIGEGGKIAYTVTIDNTAPVVKGALQDLITGDIYVKAQDENYIAYVAITNKSGNKVFFETVPEQNKPGEEIEVPLELEGVSLPNEVVLLVADYAGNEAAFKVNLGGSGEQEDNGGLMIGFVKDTTTAAPGEGNRVWEIDKDQLSYNYSAGTYEGLGVYANTDVSVRAAEYVDGYVFMAATDGWLYAAELTALDEASRVGKFSDTVNEIYDMAFNYKDETLYALGDDNTVYSVDLITGALTPVVHITLDGASGSYAVANTMAINDNGVFYVAGYGSTSYATLYKFELPEVEEEEEEEVSELGEKVYAFGFETDYAEEGWQFIDADGDGSNWSVDTSAPAEGTKCILSASYAGGTALNPDNWAISPAINLADYDEATFSIQGKNYMSSYPETLALYAGLSDDPAEMVKVSEDFMPDTVWTQYTGDLADFVGEEEVYVAVRHYNSYDQFRVYVDQIEVFGKVNETEPEPEEPVEALEITAAPVGLMGVYNYNGGGALAWDHNEGILYLASNYNTTQDYDHYLWVINTSNGKATRANEVAGTGNNSSNQSARLYGCVNGLIIVPGHTSLIQPTEEPTDIVVEPEVLYMMKGQSEDLTVAVFPWTLIDKDVTFESADPSIASVNDRGTVSAVNVGETEITVTTVAEPNLTAKVLVVVTEPPVAELRGVIWDENGKGQASVFETNATNDWEALSVVGQFRWGALIDDMVYGSTADTMMAFDADTYEVETYGGIVSMWIPSDAAELQPDIVEAFAEMGYTVGHVLAPNNNGTYLSMIDPEEGSILYFDLSSYVFGSDPMATISYMGRGVYDDGEDYDDNAAVYYVMTESGDLYTFTMNHSGSVMWELVGSTGIDLSGVSDSTNEVWASMVYVPENEFIYLSLYNGADDYAHLYAIDAKDPTVNGDVGDFNENVWPVTGLYQYEPATDLSLKVKPLDIVLFEGETAELSIKVKLGETNEYTVEVADPTICSFEDGIVTGLKEGNTTITVTTVDTNEAGEHLSETVNVKVKGFKSIEAFVGAQVTDNLGARFTKISLDGAVASKKGTAAPGDVTSGGRCGDIYIAGVGTTPYVLDAETYETDNTWNGIDSYFSTYPPMDIANYPNHLDSSGNLDDHRALFTTSLGWLVYPDYYGWNLSSILPDMAGICFGGTSTSDSSTIYVYYVMTTAGVLYEIDVDPTAGSLNYSELFDTGILFEDQSDCSMAWLTTADLHGDWEVDVGEQGIVVADNGSKKIYFIDFMAETEEDLVNLVGVMDAENVSGLIGTFDDLATIVDVEPEPEPEPEPYYVGDVISGFYFEEDPEEEGWVFYDDDEDGFNWFWNLGDSDYATIGAYEGSGMLMSNSYDNFTEAALTPDNWAFSPAIDLTGAADDVMLAFWAKAQDPDWADENFAVYVQVSGEEGMNVLIPETTVTGDWVQYTAPLADYIGKQISIGIRHFDSTDMYMLDVDQVEILENVELVEPGPAPEPDPIITGNVIAADSFEGDPFENGWTNVDADGSDNGWYWDDGTTFDEPGAYEGVGMVYSQSYINGVGAQTPDNWLVSSAIDLSDAEDDAIVSLYAKGQDPSWSAEVFAIYAGTSTNTDSMTKIGGDFTATGDWTQYTASLADFIGEDEVYIAVRHYNVTDQYWLDVDKIEVLDDLTEGGEAAKDVPAKTYEAVPMALVSNNPLNLGRAMLNVAEQTEALTAVKMGEETAAFGGTNAIRGAVRGDLRMPVDATAAEDGVVTIDLTEDVAVTNGLYAITYNADVLTFEELTTDLVFNAYSHEIYEPAEDEPALRTGTITFAFADAEEIPAETILASLKFSYTEDEIDTTVVVVPYERNDEAVEDESLVIPIHVETPKDPNAFYLSDTLVDGAQVVIYAPFFGKALSNEAVSTSYRAGKDITPEDDIVWNPAADIVWNVTEVEGGFEFTDAEGHKLSIQAGKNNLPLDADDTVWEIVPGEADKNVYIVSTTSVGSSGDHRAIEWYSRYNEFSAYYLADNSDLTLFTMQMYVNKNGDYELPVHEHEYGDPVWAWNEDLTAATATFTCDCGDEQVLDAEITEEIITEALPHIAGEKKLIATVEFEGEEYTDEKTVEIEALPCPCEMFEDMPEYGTIEHDAIDWAFTQEPKITEGMDATHFGPEVIVTRAQAMRFLWNAAKQPAPASTENPFTDVREGKWYTDPVLWGYHNDPRITNGMSDTEFGINVTCSRGHIITFLWNALGQPEPTIENPYTDITKPDGSGRFYTTAAIWAYEAGIFKGEDGLFNPGVDCTRAEIVTYLYRYYTGEGLME